MLSLIEQVCRAQRKRGWSVQQLLDASGLEIDRSVLHRKLKGETTTTAEELEALAAGLEMTLVWTADEEIAS